MISTKRPAVDSWPVVRLGDIACVIVGGTPNTAHRAFWENGTVPWMSSGDVHLRRIDDVSGRITESGLRSSNAKLVSPPSIAIALAGQGKTRGTAAYVTSRLSTNQSVALIVPHDERLRPEYIFHNLDGRYEELRAWSAGGGRAGLTISILESIPIALPTPTEQRRIAEILDAADVAIRQTEALIAKLRQAKAGLLHDLLTLGLDEQGRLRDPIAKPEKFRDTTIGKVPKEWQVSEVSTEFDITSGFTLGEHRRPRHNPRQYLRVANVQRDRIDVSDLLELEASPSEMSGMRLESGDLLIDDSRFADSERPFTQLFSRFMQLDDNIRRMGKPGKTPVKSSIYNIQCKIDNVSTFIV